MSAEVNREVLRNAYAEASKGNGQPLLDALHDDIVWTISGTTVLSGTSKGKAEVVEKIFRPLRARLADGPVVFTPELFVSEGEHVVMVAKGRATAKSGRPYNNSYCIVARFEGGRIREMTDYIDTELITSALGS